MPRPQRSSTTHAPGVTSRCHSVVNTASCHAQRASAVARASGLAAISNRVGAWPTTANRPDPVKVQACAVTARNSSGSASAGGSAISSARASHGRRCSMM
nr:hypothetical protein [Sphingomonas sp.]